MKNANGNFKDRNQVNICNPVSLLIKGVDPGQRI